MKSITTRLAVFAVVLTVALSVMVAPAMATPSDKVTVSGGAGDDALDDKFPDTIFDDKFPDTIFDGNDNFPDTIFSEKNLFPDTIFNDDENQDGSDPVITK